jgi:hypothetical protein
MSKDIVRVQKFKSQVPHRKPFLMTRDRAQSLVDTYKGAVTYKIIDEQNVPDVQPEIKAPEKVEKKSVSPVGGDRPFNPSEHTVRAVQAWLKDGQDINTIKAATELERGGKNRKSLISLLETAVNS